MIIINILFEDKHLIICTKPIGVLSEDEMPKLLKERFGGEFHCVHRLDRAVSGVMVYAKTKAAAAKLTGLIASHEVKKEYLAIISGAMLKNEGVLQDLLFKDSAKNKSYVVKRMRKGVKPAELKYKQLSTVAGNSLLKIELHTGRSHQIRVQFSSRQHPLLGDVKYGSLKKDCDIALFSHALSFRHPFTREIIEVSALPESIKPWSSFEEAIKALN